MRLIFGLCALAILAIAFLVWRAIARSPKLDGLFNFSKRDETAEDIFTRQTAAERDLNTRGRTLGKRQAEISQELGRINKRKQ